MNTRNTLLALALTAAAAPAFAQDIYTNVAPYTDGPTPVSVWKGSLSRSDVIEQLMQAQRSGTLPVAYDISVAPAMKFTPDAQGMASAPDHSVLGGARADMTLDGHRFIGGEAGYSRVGDLSFGR